MVSLSTVRGDEDLMIVTDMGMIIRTHLDQILTIGRDTQGVCVIKLNEGHLVSTIAIVPRSDDETEEEDDEYKEDYELDLSYQFYDEKQSN
jgi:DNA gyrase subunit A